MSMTLRTARQRRKWTQQQLADKAGLDQGQISRLESGYIADPAYSTVLALEAALDLKPGTLTFGEVAEAS